MNEIKYSDKIPQAAIDGAYRLINRVIADRKKQIPLNKNE